MKQILNRNERRRFLKFGSLAIAFIVNAAEAEIALAQGALSRVDDNESEALRLGYKHDATQVDGKSFPAYREDQRCSNCQFYKAEPGEAWGPCQVFKGRLVSVKGWCKSYFRKS